MSWQHRSTWSARSSETAAECQPRTAAGRSSAFNAALASCGTINSLVSAAPSLTLPPAGGVAEISIHAPTPHGAFIRADLLGSTVDDACRLRHLILCVSWAMGSDAHTRCRRCAGTLRTASLRGSNQPPSTNGSRAHGRTNGLLDEALFPTTMHDALPPLCRVQPCARPFVRTDKVSQKDMSSNRDSRSALACSVIFIHRLAGLSPRISPANAASMSFRRCVSTATMDAKAEVEGCARVASFILASASAATPHVGV